MGGSERGSRAWTHPYTPRGRAGRWKPLEELSTSHSLQAAVSRCESLPTRAPQPLSFKWGRTASVGSVGKVSEAPSTPGSISVRRSGRSALLFLNRKVRLPPQFRLRLDNPMSLLLPGWSPFFPPDSYLVSQSHKWGKSQAAWKLAVKEPHQDRRGETILGALHAGLSELGCWSRIKRFCSPHVHITLLLLVSTRQHIHISRQQAPRQRGRATKKGWSPHVG